MHAATALRHPHPRAPPRALQVEFSGLAVAPPPTVALAALEIKVPEGIPMPLQAEEPSSCAPA